MKSVIITGHSKGLGNAIAKRLMTDGYNLLGLSRSKVTMAESYRGTVQQVALDLSDTQRVIEWLDSGYLREFLSQADDALLINNAGIVDPINPIGRQSPTSISMAVSINVTAALLLSNAFVEAAEGVSSKRLVHVSSGAARSAYSGWSVYCATKAALDHHARCIVADGIPNLRVASIAPGIIDTDMQTSIRDHSEDEFPSLEKFRNLKSSGQLASPGSAAETLIRFLESDEFGRDVCVDVRDL